MQATRRAERDKYLDKAAALAQLNFSEGHAYNPDFDFAPDSGFTFSIHEIEVRIGRNKRLRRPRLSNRHWPARQERIAGWSRRFACPLLRGFAFQLRLQLPECRILKRRFDAFAPSLRVSPGRGPSILRQRPNMAVAS